MVQGEVPQPVKKEGDVSTSQALMESEWKKNNNTACWLIHQAISEDLQQFVLDTYVASERWSMLKNRCQGGDHTRHRAL